MHSRNLSFLRDEDRPYGLAPAYDMLPMALSPSADGVLRDTLLPPNLHPSVEGPT